MQTVEITTDPEFEAKFRSYPPPVRACLLRLRELILDVATTHPEIEVLRETLRWGEPSFLTGKGSTLRIDWKAKAPDRYATYFKCTSQLISTFRAVYGGALRYENKRAILFRPEETLPTEILRKCITMAHTYHSINHSPRLGHRA